MDKRALAHETMLEYRDEIVSLFAFFETLLLFVMEWCGV
jgi:hypothetical protein